MRDCLGAGAFHPKDEAERLENLESLQVLDTPAEERFDRITRLARRILGTEIALISLVDRDRQWFKSAQGLDAPETSREISFCGHAILEDEPFLIPDAHEDERFSDNPLVTGDPNIRLYAGHPLRSPNGKRIGTLCAIDSTPRELSLEDSESLRDLASLAEMELRVEKLSEAERLLRTQLVEANERASVDGLTRLWNREAISRLLKNEWDRHIKNESPLGVILLDLDHFKQINDTYGHLIGDRVLTAVSQRLRGVMRRNDSIGRFGGEEFLVVLTECEADEAPIVADRLRQTICKTPISTPEGTLKVTASLGYCTLVPSEHQTLESLLQAADEALYRSKAHGRNRAEAGTLK